MYRKNSPFFFLNAHTPAAVAPSAYLNFTRPLYLLFRKTRRHIYKTCAPRMTPKILKKDEPQSTQALMCSHASFTKHQMVIKMTNPSVKQRAPRRIHPQIK